MDETNLRVLPAVRTSGQREAEELQRLRNEVGELRAVIGRLADQIGLLHGSVAGLLAEMSGDHEASDE